MTLPPFKTQWTFAKVIFKINRNHLENLCLCVSYLSTMYQQNIASSDFSLRNLMIFFKIKEVHKLRLFSFIEKCWKIRTQGHRSQEHKVCSCVTTFLGKFKFSPPLLSLKGILHIQFISASYTPLGNPLGNPWGNPLGNPLGKPLGKPLGNLWESL